MTREEFKAKAKGVVDAQTFGKLGKLFEYDDYEDMKIAYIPDDLMSSEADMPLDDFLDDIYEQIVKSLVTPTQKWIPCSEKLPDTDDYVLCWYEYYHWSQEKVLPEYGLGCYLKETSAWFGEVANGKDARVIAWMPLPEPYKKEVEE